MSFTQAPDRSALLKPYDDWLGQAGVMVPPMRKSLAAYLAEKESAAPVLEHLDAAASKHGLVANAVAASGYNDSGTQLAKAEAAYDYGKAVQCLQEMQKKAGALKPMVDYCGSSNAIKERGQISKGELALSTSGNLFATQRQPFEAARARQVTAEAALDVKAATAARAEAAKLGSLIAFQYNEMFEAERLRPLAERAQKILDTAKASKALDARRPVIEKTLSNLKTCWKTQDYSDYNQQTGPTLEFFIKTFQGPTPDDWWDAGMASPSGVRKAYDRMRGGGKGTQNPVLKSLSEKQKLAAIQSALIATKPASIVSFAKAAFSDLKVLGLDWNVSPVELAALYAYTTNDYDQVNKFLRSQAAGNPQVTPKGVDVLAAIAHEALTKLPPYDPVGFPLFRFEKVYGDFLTSRYTPGTTFQIAEFWSTGAAGGANISGNADAEIVVWGKKVSACKNVGPISASKGEGKKGVPLKGQGQGEVLFPPGSKFRTVINARKEELARKSSTLRYRIEVVEV